MDLDFINGAFFAGIKVSGKDYAALVDTGADATMLLTSECVALGLDPEGARNLACLHGDRKEVPMFTGDIDFHGTKLKLSIVGMPREIPIPGQIVKATIGRDALSASTLNLDFRKGTGSIN